MLWHSRTLAAAVCLVFSFSGEGPAATRLIGYFDGIGPGGTAFGWAVDLNAPNQPIEVEIYVDEPAGSSEPVARADAEYGRQDVNTALKLSGNYGFATIIPAAFWDDKPHQLYVYAVGLDGKVAELDRSPQSFQLPIVPDHHLKADASLSAHGISIVTGARFGGAIASLRWNGKEFVDNQDHGREIQTAWQGNNAGECFNPSEAGSADDGIGLNSTSEVLSTEVTAAAIKTISHPAFWLKPGAKGVFCGFNPAEPTLWEGGTALNRAKVSQSTLRKTVSIGFGLLPNVLVYDSEIVLARDELAAYPLHFIMLENPAAYLRHEFSHMYRYDTAAYQLHSQGLTRPHFANASPLPVIAATADGEHAIGLYTADIPREGFPGALQEKVSGYTFTHWGGTVSISARMPAMANSGRILDAGRYHYRTFMIIGSVADVSASIKQLILSLSGSGR